MLTSWVPASFRLSCWLLLPLLLKPACYAADYSTIYPPSQLQAELPRLQTAIDFLIKTEIQPFISPQEATAFGLQAIDLPLDGDRSDPLDFYQRNRRIILPVRTLLFVEDLSRAYGWMWTNRFSTKTIDEYLNMLHYRSASDFPSGNYPPPLQALHVPEDALSDPKVVESSVRLRRTAYTFILLHQFAHLQLRHEVTGAHAYSESEEEDADHYALNIMKENSVTPTGLLVVMYGLVFLDGGTSLHPATPQRLQAMAHFMDSRITEFVRGRRDTAAAMDGIHSIASLLVEASEWLSVRQHQGDLQQLALKTNAGTLQPRPLPRATR